MVFNEIMIPHSLAVQPAESREPSTVDRTTSYCSQHHRRQPSSSSIKTSVSSSSTSSSSSGSTSSSSASASSSRYNKPGNILLPAGFTPNNYTVLCGRGKACFHAVGNQRFRCIVYMFLDQYSRATRKLEKSRIVRRVLETIHSAGGQFVQKDEEQRGGDGQSLWWQISDQEAHEKVGALFRDCLHTQYRSASKAKAARRRDSQRQELLQHQQHQPALDQEEEERKERGPDISRQQSFSGLPPATTSTARPTAAETAPPPLARRPPPSPPPQVFSHDEDARGDDEDELEKRAYSIDIFSLASLESFDMDSDNDDDLWSLH